MNRNIREKHPKNYLVLVLLIYLVAGIFLLKYYRYQINPDGISYISIAGKYLNGDFSNAVNGWWGPMFSWLLMPFLLLGVEPLLAAKILNLIIGSLAILTVWMFSHQFPLSSAIRKVILFSLIPIVLSFSMSDITPDLLLMCLLLAYLRIIFQPDYAATIKKGALCGVWGSFAYFAKSYAFPFFISHFFIMNVLHYFRADTKQTKKKVVCNFLAGAVVFALVSGVWVGLLSNKYGKLTFGTAGKAAYRIKAAPDAPGAGVLWLGFLEPSNPTATSAWEDHSYLEIPPYEHMDSWSFVKNQLKVTSRIIGKMANIFMDFSPLSIAICIAYVLFWLQGFNIAKMPAEVLYPTVTIVLFAGGYSLVTVNARYLWVICIMLMLMGGYAMARLVQNNFFTKTRRTALLIIFFLSFAVPAYDGLKSYANRGKSVYNLSKVLENAIAPHSNIAANTNWAPSLYLSYHLDCKYYGTQKKNISKIELKRQLEKYGIDYYLFWGGAALDLRFLPNYKEITGGRIPGLRIYGLKKRR